MFDPEGVRTSVTDDYLSATGAVMSTGRVYTRNADQALASETVTTTGSSAAATPAAAGAIACNVYCAQLIGEAGLADCATDGCQEDATVLERLGNVLESLFGPAEADQTITGYTSHGLEQALGRDGHGVCDEAIQDAVNNYTSKVAQDNGTIRYVGQDAVVVLNSSGKVVTTWATNSGGWRQ